MPSQPYDVVERWLLGDDAQPWLEQAAESNQPVHQLAEQLRRGLSVEQTHRVLELVELRKRGTAKFTRAPEMFFTRVGLEQATDEWIARYKAQRFANLRVADMCCGLGGDAIGLVDLASELTLIDRSSVPLAYAQQNVRIYAGDKSPLPRGECGDARVVSVADVDAWHIDPDRRPAGRRTTQVDLHEPSASTIDQMLAANATAAIKLAPACDVPPRWADAGELEWVSRDGECKQLVVWHGRLASQPGKRRATVVATRGDAYDVLRTLVGNEVATPHDDEIGRYLFEPDPAVLASGLVGELAAAHGWWTFASTTGYLTGDQPVDESACVAFEVQDVLPLQTKKLSRYLRERSIGRVEIKHRAIDVSPEKLRRDLKLTGDNAATLLLTRVGEKRIAIVANRS